MSVEYPDVSGYQRGLSLRGAPLVVAKATQGTSFVDPCFAGFRAQARSDGTPFAAYHWLDTADAGTQARHCFSIVGPGTPLMIDDEQPPIVPAHTLAFVVAYRALGGTVTLEYGPHWAWAASGSPDLRPLADAGLHLVASDYNPADDVVGGRGWAAYGGVTPSIVQTTDKRQFNGQAVDFNTYPGSLPQLLAIIAGTRTGDLMQWNGPATAGLIGGRDPDTLLIDIWCAVMGNTSVFAKGVEMPLQGRLDMIAAAATASAAKVDAVAAAVHALATSGTSVDTAAVVTAIQQVGQAESAAVAALGQQLAVAQQNVAALQAKLTAAGHALGG